MNAQEEVTSSNGRGAKVLPMSEPPVAIAPRPAVSMSDSPANLLAQEDW